jgi:hypothetical protein
MTIYAQPNSWQCGPFALKHGLLALGVYAHEDALARIAGSTEQLGTDDRQLARAALAHGCTLTLVRRAHSRSARREMSQWFARGLPLLLCLDQWEHWVTAVSADREHVVVFDSTFDHAVLRLEPWERVMARLVFRRRRWQGLWTQRLYDVHALVPAHDAGPRLRLTVDRARRVLEHEGGALADRWDEYARRLLPLAVATGRTAHLARLDAFLGSQADRIAAEVERFRGSALRPEVERELGRLALAAEVYDLRLRPMLMRRAVARVAGIVSGFLPAKPARVEPRRVAAPVRVIAASA